MNPLMFLGRKDISPIRRIMMLESMSRENTQEYTAIGNPVTFNTSVQKPLSKCLLSFTPTQDGTNPSPTNVCPISGWTWVNAWRTGKNMLNAISDNILPFNNASFANYTLNNGTIVTHGNTFFGFKVEVEPSTVYNFSFDASKTVVMEVIAYSEEPSAINSNDNFIVGQSLSSYSFTTPSDCKWLSCGIYTTETDAVIKDFQLEFGDTATTFEEYTYQFYDVVFPTMGKNLFDKYAITDNKMLDTQTGEPVDSVSHCISDFIPVKQGESVYIPATDTTRRWFYGTDKTALIYLNDTGNQVYTPVQDGFIRVTILKSTINLDTYQIEYGSSATSYEPYTNTAYGGTIDLVTGVLTVEWYELAKTWGDFIAKTSLGDNTRGVLSIASNPSKGTGVGAMCNIATRNTGWSTDSVHFYTNEGSCVVFLPNDTDNSTKIQVVYPLATPIVYQLTPTEILSLANQTNAIWSNVNGNIEVTYKDKRTSP